MSLPESGYCILNTALGNIELQVPVNTSATLYVKSDYGLVTYSNLNFDSLVHNPDFLSGILGGGKGEIEMHSRDGDIIISGFRHYNNIFELRNRNLQPLLMCKKSTLP